MTGLLRVLLLARPTVRPHHGEKLLLAPLDAVEVLEVHREDEARGVGQQEGGAAPDGDGDDDGCLSVFDSTLRSRSYPSPP